MGGSRDDADDWRKYTTATRASVASGATTFASSYTARGDSGVKPEYDPLNIVVRESVASPANPHPTPVIIALDCTGSMNRVALSAVANIGTLMAEVYDRLPVPDPQVMAMFFDDVFVSSKPLQATQFEADSKIIDQLKSLSWIGHGGGNDSESSGLPLFFAANKCSCDAFKEGRKGFIFLIGDDGPPPPLTEAHVRQVFGPDFAFSEEQSFADLLAQVEENWHVFNVIPTQGAPHYTTIIDRWQKVIGERMIVLEDIDKLAEVLVATMQVVSGVDAATVAASFSDPGTSLVVADAIKNLTPVGGGVVRL